MFSFFEASYCVLVETFKMYLRQNKSLPTKIALRGSLRHFCRSGCSESICAVDRMRHKFMCSDDFVYTVSADFDITNQLMKHNREQGTQKSWLEILVFF